MMRKKLGVLIAVFGVAAAPACAEDWTVDYKQSHVGFIGTQNTEQFSGGFRNFQVTIDFDPAKPETGSITAVIDMTSAFVGGEERNNALPGSDWLNTSKFPQAVFSTTTIKADTCDVETPADTKLIGCYKANGVLSIKGIAKPVTLGFYLTQDKTGTGVHAQGKTTLIRTDFGVGLGQWSDESVIKYAVDVTIDIAAKPVS